MKSHTKLASILEVLISSMLFLVVLFVGIDSLLAMNKNTNRLSDFNISKQCSNLIEDRLNNKFSSAATVYGFKNVDGDLEFQEIESGQGGEFSGIGIKSVLPAGVEELEIIVKKKQGQDYKFFQGSVEMGKHQINNNDKLDVVEPKLQSMNCNSSDETNPFIIRSVNKYQPNDPSKGVEVELNDTFFIGSGKENFSRIYFHEFKQYD